MKISRGCAQWGGAGLRRFLPPALLAVFLVIPPLWPVGGPAAGKGESRSAEAARGLAEALEGGGDPARALLAYHGHENPGQQRPEEVLELLSAWDELGLAASRSPGAPEAAAAEAETASVESASSLPGAVRDWALFGCEGQVIVGRNALHGVPSAGGERGFGGHVGSNGSVLIHGKNRIDGDAVPGPGHLVHVFGSGNVITGSTDPADAEVPCEGTDVTQWADYARDHNDNASIPSGHLDPNGWFILDGGDTCTLSGGLYYVQGFVACGTGGLLVTGPAVFVSEGPVLIHGNAEINVGGSPDDLLLVTAKPCAPVLLGGKAKARLQVYAPRSLICAAGSLEGCGNLWGWSVLACGSVEWDRPVALPLAVEITAPPDGLVTASAGVDVAGNIAGGPIASADLNGAEIEVIDGRFEVSAFPLDSGSNVLTVTAMDVLGSRAQDTVTVHLDQDPPVILIEGVTDGSHSSSPVTPQVTVVDAYPDPASVVVTLDGAPCEPGATVAAEGAHTLSAAASDQAGNASSAQAAFTLDFTEPIIAVTGVEDGGFYGGVVSPQVSVQDAYLDPETVLVTLDGSPYVSGTPIDTDGPHTLDAAAADLAGNEASLSISFSLDLSAPDITVSGIEEGGLYGEAVSPQVTVTDDNLDADSVHVTLDGRSFPTGGTVDGDGSHVLAVSASDIAGNAAHRTVTFTLDLTAPTIRISGVAEGGTYSRAVRPLFSAEDPHLEESTVSATLNGQSFVSGTAVAAAGPYVLSVSASDALGNTAAMAASFRIDLSAPVITVSGVEEGACYPSSVTPVIEVTDEDIGPDSVTVTLDGSPFASGDPVGGEGDHTLQVVAVDAVGHTAQEAVRFALDLTDPEIRVVSPSDHSSTNASPAVIRGTVIDAHPHTVEIDGAPVGAGGESSFEAEVALAEGENTIALEATDRAGRAASLHWHIHLDTAAPTVAVTAPIEGSVTGRTAVAVIGQVSPEVLTVFVESFPAGIIGGTFTAHDVTLPVEGTNVLTAVALDGAGNEASAQVTVVRDTVEPAVAFTAPADGAHTASETILLEGTVSDASGVTVTLDGFPVTLSGGAFSETAPLSAGKNWITLRAEDAAGNITEAHRIVHRDEGDFSVRLVDPLDGTIGVSNTAVVDVFFSRTVDFGTVTEATFAVTSGGAPLVGAFTALEDRVTFIPQSPYPDGAVMTVALSDGILDLGGSPLLPFVSTFSTRTTPGGDLTVRLDTPPTLTNAGTLTVSGDTAPLVDVTVSGGGAPVTCIVSSEGRFSVEVPLEPNALNAFEIVASLGAEPGPAVPFAVLQDSERPFLTSFDADPEGDILCDFNEAMDGVTVTADSVLLLVDGAPVLLTAVLERGDTRLRLTPEDAWPSDPAVFMLGTGLTDRAGNALSEPFTYTFNGGTTGDAFLVGEVYDGETGLPLPGAVVTLLASDGSALPVQAVTGGWGAWALGVPARDLWLHVGAAGYADAYRYGEPADGDIRMVPDARLAPLCDEIQIVSEIGGTAVFGGGAASVAVPDGAFGGETTLRLTELQDQALPLQLPGGFTPLAAYRLDCSEAPSQPLTLTFTVNLPAGPVPAARFDREERAWIGLAEASSDGSTATVILPSPGAPALSITASLLRADDVPESVTISEGQVLNGAGEWVLDAVEAATLTADPPTILPDERAAASVSLSTGSAYPSGTPFQVTFTETLDMADGSTHAYSPYTSDLYAFQDTADPTMLLAAFPVSPFPGIDVYTLLEGRIEVSAGPRWEETTGGGIYDPSGGDFAVTGATGTRVELPPGASEHPLPVRLFPVAESTLMASIPAGFTFAGGIELKLGGAVLDEPAVLSIDEGALAVSVTESDIVVLAAARTLSGVATFILTDLAVLDESGDEPRLRTHSGGTGAPSGLESLPWPTVLEEGRYVFLKSDGSYGFVAGLVRDDLANPVAGAIAGECFPAVNPFPEGGTAPSPRFDGSFKGRVEALVESGGVPESALQILDMTGINALSGEGGSYVVPATLGTPTLRAVNLLTGDTGDMAASVADPQSPDEGRHIDLAITAIAVESTSPADGAEGVAHATDLLLSFTKLVDPSALAGTVTVTADGEPVTGGLRVVFGGKTVLFSPNENLPQGALVTVEVSGVPDRIGRPMAGVHAFSFTTSVDAVTRLDPGLIRALLPDGGMITVAGGAGSVEGGAVVYLENVTHPEYGIASVPAQADGFFSLSIPGALGDRVELRVLGLYGGERVYAFEQFVSATGDAVAMGPNGGIFTALHDGQPLATIHVPTGAFDEPTVITLRPETDPSAVAPVPDGFLAGEPVAVEFEGDAAREIDIFLHAPADYDPSLQQWLVRSLSWGPEGALSPMVLDTMRSAPCPGEPGSGCLVTNSPPHPGISEASVVQLYQADPRWGFVHGEFTHTSAVTNNVVVWSPETVFVYLQDWDRTGYDWTLPLPWIAPPGGYPIVFQDAETHQIIAEIKVLNPPPEGSVADIGIVTSDQTKSLPYPMASSPFRSFPFQLQAVPPEPVNGTLYIDFEFATPPDVHVYAGGGTTASRDNAIVDPLNDESQYIEVSIFEGGATPAASGRIPVRTDGQVNFHLADLTDGESLREHVTSGRRLTISYPLPGPAPGMSPGRETANVAEIPGQPVTQGMGLELRAGRLVAVLDAEFAPTAGPNPTFRLYDAMVRHEASPLLVFEGTLDGAETLIDLGDPRPGGMTVPFRVGDVLFYTLPVPEADPAAGIEIVFDRPLGAAPAGDPSAPAAADGLVHLVSLTELPGGEFVERQVPLSLHFDNEEHPRIIRVVPDAPLEPGIVCELRCEGLRANDGSRYPIEDESIVKGGFAVHSSGVFQDVPYRAMYDMVRRGALLYVAAGNAVDEAGAETQNGALDILDMSDPSHPARLGPLAPVYDLGPPEVRLCYIADGNCPPQIDPLLSRARGVAIAENAWLSPPDPVDPWNTGDPCDVRTLAAVVGGGATSAGYLSLFLADEAGTRGSPDCSPEQTESIGTMVGGTTLCLGLADPNVGPKGVPQLAKVFPGSLDPATNRPAVDPSTGLRSMPPRAYVSTLGVGLLQVDVDKAARQDTRATEFILDSFKMPFTGDYPDDPRDGDHEVRPGVWPDWPYDISAGIRGLGILPAVDANGTSYVIAAVEGLGMVAWDVTHQTSQGPTPVAVAPFYEAPERPWYTYDVPQPDTLPGVGLWRTSYYPGARPSLMDHLFRYEDADENGDPVSVENEAPSGALRVQVYPGYWYEDEEGGAHQTNLMLVAGGRTGLLVYAVYGYGVTPFMELRAVIHLDRDLYDADGNVTGHTEGNVYDVVLDTRRKVAYVTDFNDEIVIVDMRNPFRTSNRAFSTPAPLGTITDPQNPAFGLEYFIDRPPNAVVEKLDFVRNNPADPDDCLPFDEPDGLDDRIVGTIPLCPSDAQAENCSARSTLILDSDTGLLYVGAMGAVDPNQPNDPDTGGGLKTIGAYDPRLTFVTEDAGGNLSEPPYLSAHAHDEPLLALWAPGGAGPEMDAALQMIDPRGRYEERGDLPLTAVRRSTATDGFRLLRASNRKTDAAYNFFRQDPNLRLTMEYSGDPAEMVSRAGGSIRGTVDLSSSYGGDTGQWGGMLTAETPVTGPCGYALQNVEREVSVRMRRTLIRHHPPCVSRNRADPLELPQLPNDMTAWEVLLCGETDPSACTEDDFEPVDAPGGGLLWPPGVHPLPVPDGPYEDGQSFTLKARSVCPATGEPLDLTFHGTIHVDTVLLGGGLPLGHPVYKGVDLATGTYHMVREDLSRPGPGGGLSFVRTYSNARASGEQLLGHGWSFNYEVTLHHNVDCGYWAASDIDGSAYEFEDALGDDGLYPPFPGYHGKLDEIEPEVFLLTTKRGDRLTFTRAPSTEHKYRLDELADPFGNRITLGWEEVQDHTHPGRWIDRVVSVTEITDADPVGRTLEIRYNLMEGDEEYTEVSGLGAVLRYFKDGDGFLARTERIRADGDPIVESYTYEKVHPTAYGNLLSITDPVGNVTLIGYYGDEADEGYGAPPPPGAGATALVQLASKHRHVREIIEGTEQATRFAYDLGTMAPDPLDPNVVLLTTVTKGRPGEEIALEPTLYGIGGEGQPLFVTDPLGNTSRTVWDMGDLLKVLETDPLGRITRYAYNGDPQDPNYSAGDPVSIRISIDPADWDSHPHSPGGYAEMYPDPFPYPAAYGDGTPVLPVTTERAYDPAWHRLIREVTPDGIAADYTLFPETGAVRYKDESAGTGGEALARREEYAYDAEGNLTRKDMPESVSVRYEGYVRGTPTRIIDPLGNVSTRNVDPLTGLKHGEEGVRGLRESWNYDGLDRPVLHRVEGGPASAPLIETWGYYDGGKVAWHRVEAAPAVSGLEGTPETLEETYTYDSAGRKKILTVTTGDGASATQITTEWTYDAAGRVETEEIFSEWDTGTDAVIRTFEYDAAGRLIAERVDDGTGEIRTSIQEYDPTGNVTARAGHRGDLDGAGVPHATVIGYDALYRKISETAPEVKCPDGSACRPVSQWRYDAAGRVTKEVDAAGSERLYEYDALGRPARETMPLGHETRREVDLLDRVTSETNLPEGLMVSRLYDGIGRVTRETRSFPPSLPDDGSPPTSVITEVQYLDFSRHGQNRVTTTADAGGLGIVTVTDLDPTGKAWRTTVQRNGAEDLTTEIAYDGRGNVVSVTDPYGDVTESRYDGLGRNVWERSPALSLESGVTGRAVSAWTYDPAGRVVSETDPIGRITFHEFDALGRETLRTMMTPQGAIDRPLGEWVYTDGMPTWEDPDPASAPTLEVTDADGFVTKTWLDALGREVLVVDAEDRPARAGYDLLGRKTDSLDRDGNRRSFAYDALARVVGTTWHDVVVEDEAEPVDYAEAVIYDDAAGTVTTLDRMGNEHLEARDGAGRKIRETKASADGSLSITVGEWAYDGLDRMVEATDANGTLAVTQYDELGREIASTVASGTDEAYTLLTSYGFAEGMHVVTKADCSGEADCIGRELLSRTRSDAGGRLVEEEDGRGAVTSYEWDPVGNRTGIINAENERTVFTYDHRNRPATVTDAAGRLTRFEYEEYDTHTTTVVTNGEGRVSSKDYTPTKRLWKERRGDGAAHETTFLYNGEGARLSITDAMGRSFSYTPDALGREHQAIYPDEDDIPDLPTKGLKEIRRVFDPLDRPTGIRRTLKGETEDIVVGRSLMWDYLGRREGETDASGAQWAYTYDDNGNRLSTVLTLPGGAVKTVAYTYDKRNRVETVTDEAGTTLYAYDPRGDLVATVTRPDGSVERFEYDGADRLTRKWAEDAEGGIIVSYAYGYDEANRRTSQVEQHGSGAPEETRYTYDLAGQLETVTYPDGEVVTYGYDHAGNRTSEEVVDGLGTPQASKSYAYDDLDQLESVTDAVSGTVITYTYDANGNQASKTVDDGSGTATTTTFTYTSRDMLQEVAQDGNPVAAFRYDDQGRRIWKNGELAHWDGRSLVAETDEATQGLLRGYTHGLTLIRQNILGQRAETYTDVLGSVGALVPQGGSAPDSTHYRYDAFGHFRTDVHPGGSCASEPNALACNAPLTYTGHLFDQESGLFYFGSRYYDPTTARFLTHDPAAGDALNPPSLHRYLYCYNSPMVFTDPWGEVAGDWYDPRTYDKEFWKQFGSETGDELWNVASFGIREKVKAQDNLGTWEGVQESLGILKDTAGNVGTLGLQDNLVAQYEEDGFTWSGTGMGISKTAYDMLPMEETRAVVQDWDRMDAGERAETICMGVSKTAGVVAGAKAMMKKAPANAPKISPKAKIKLRERIEANIAESKAARNASRFKEGGNRPAPGERSLTKSEWKLKQNEGAHTRIRFKNGKTQALLPSKVNPGVRRWQISPGNRPKPSRGLFGDTSGSPRGGVYALIDDIETRIVRTGRSKDLVRRRGEHARDPELGEYRFETLYETDSYKLQRGLEQLVHERYNPPLNYVEPISPINPRGPSYISAAEEFLQKLKGNK